MEGDTHLMRVIQEMRSEIHKLERENKALRGELVSQHGSTPITAKDRETSESDNCNVPLKDETLSMGVVRRNISVGSAQTMQEQKGATMTVRRYSMSSSLLSYNSDYKHSKNMKRYSSSATLELNGSAQELESDPAEELAIEKDATAQIPAGNLRVNTITKTRSFQEYMHKCRGKVKAVTFLLPMDMSAYTENRINLQGPQNQNVNHLSTIAEKDP